MDRKTCMFLMVQIIFLVFIGSASAGSFWWSGYADWKDSTWSKVTIRITSYNVCYTKLLRICHRPDLGDHPVNQASALTG